MLSSNSWAVPALTKAEIPPDVYEGRPVKIKLTFEWPTAEGAYEIKVPKDILLSNVELLDLSQSQESYSTSSQSFSQLVLVYKVLPMSAGRGTINGFDIHYRKTDNQPSPSSVRRDTKWKTLSVPIMSIDIKPSLPWKRILILVSIPAVLILPFALWFLRAAWADRRQEKRFQSDPKQQVYVNTARMFSLFISGYTGSSLQSLLSKWSTELMNVITTYYDIPIRTATKLELLKELDARNLPAGEFREIEDLFGRLEHLKFSTEQSVTSQDVEKLRVSLLQYVKGKIIMGNLV